LLAEVVERTGLPVLCKDFIISEHQIRLAKEAGASAVLLIVKILEEGQLHALAESARQFGLEPVIEINNQAELEIVMHLDAEVVLINNRDLDTMQIDLETTARLTTRLRQEHPSADTLKIISASGISTRDDILRLAGHANNFLIGSALMKSDSPAKLLASFTDGTQMTSSPDAVLAGDRTASAQQGR